MGRLQTGCIRYNLRMYKNLNQINSSKKKNCKELFLEATRKREKVNSKMS